MPDLMILDQEVSIPAWVGDLASFRRWATSDERPRRGRFSWIRGRLWVDLEMEQLITHGRVKAEFAEVLGRLSKSADLGWFFHDRTLLTHPEAGLSTEPDGSFASWDTLRTQRLRMVPGRDGGFVELEGTPDMVLEVVSDGSVTKDLRVMREDYHRIGVREYWIIDVRRQTFRFDLLRHTKDGWVRVEPGPDGARSEVFGGRAFRLSTGTDPLGHATYTLHVAG